LAKTGKNASFFAVLSPGVGRAGQHTASLQFSIENNSIGMDWVLLDEANISLEKEFIAFASQERLTLSRGEANKVKYLRARGGEDWAAIATRLLNHLFGSARTSRMALIVDGFEWPGKNPSSSAL
ncbi:MAG: hypothetical protein LBE21_11040, partial [Pseudomonadales bacterium]|nr:hypothetical protein [Pseudomonadales bacterium]